MTARQFGRAVRLTAEQRKARTAAVALYALFAVATIGALQTTSEGLAVLLMVLAFGALFAGMAAASEA